MLILSRHVCLAVSVLSEVCVNINNCVNISTMASSSSTRRTTPLPTPLVLLPSPSPLPPPLVCGSEKDKKKRKAASATLVSPVVAVVAVVAEMLVGQGGELLRQMLQQHCNCCCATAAHPADELQLQLLTRPLHVWLRAPCAAALLHAPAAEFLAGVSTCGIWCAINGTAPAYVCAQVRTKVSIRANVFVCCVVGARMRMYLCMCTCIYASTHTRTLCRAEIVGVLSTTVAVM